MDQEELKQESYHDIKSNCQEIAEKVINEFLDKRVYHPKDS
jgi:hypothetical protein